MTGTNFVNPLLRINVHYGSPIRVVNERKKQRGSVKRDLSKATVREHQQRALELRLTGMSHRAIAEALGVSDHTTIHKRVKSALNEIIREPAEAVIKMELERLDILLNGLWEQARGGDLQALDRALKIQDRRARYLGLDAPTKTQEVPMSALTDEQLKAKWKELTGLDYVDDE